MEIGTFKHLPLLSLNVKVCLFVHLIHCLYMHSKRKREDEQNELSECIALTTKQMCSKTLFATCGPFFQIVADSSSFRTLWSGWKVMRAGILTSY